MRAGIYCTIYQVEYTTESRLFHRNSNVKQHASSENHCYNLIYAMQYNVALHIVFYSYIFFFLHFPFTFMNEFQPRLLAFALKPGATFSSMFFFWSKTLSCSTVLCHLPLRLAEPATGLFIMKRFVLIIAKR